MSLRSPRSPLSPSHQGFLPLSNAGRDDKSMRTSNDAGIPLTTVRSAASTGSRRLGTTMTEQQSAPVGDMEKANSFFKRKGGKRKMKKLDSKSRIGTDGEEQSVNALGRFYDRIINSSPVTRNLIYIAPIALLLAIPIIISKVTEGGREGEIGGLSLFNFFLWIEIVWLCLWAAKLVAVVIPTVFVFFCGVVSSGTRKYATVLRALEIPISFLGWAIGTFVSFNIIARNVTEDWKSIMVHILLGFLIASAVYLAEKLFIQLVSISYHQRSFDIRIKESKRKIYLLGLLFDASRSMFPMYCKEFEEEDYLINDSIEAMIMANNAKGHSRSGSVTPMHFIGDIGRFGDKVTSAFGNIASEITGKQVFNPNSAHSIIIEALEKKRSSEALAKRLWMSFVVEGSDALMRADIAEVLGPGRHEEADECFEFLDNDSNGDVSLDEMVLKVVEMSRERKALANSMHDVGEAIGVLDSVLVIFVLIIVVLVFISLLNTSFVTTLATASTTLLSLSFVFALTTQEFLAACIFLFVKHPYDVGDRCDITGPEKESLVVEKISLLYTVFKRVDNNKICQVPNNVLNNLWIENITRSKAMKEQLEVFISFDTSFEDIELLRLEMEKFVAAPENSRDFQQDFILECTSINSMDKLSLKIEIRHKSNWHVESVRATRRSKFMCALVLALRRVPIYGPGGGGLALGDPGNPSYSVAVTDDFAAAARDDAAQKKDAKRLVPTAIVLPTPSQNSTSTGVEVGSKTAEEQAASALTSRKPVRSDTDLSDDSGDRTVTGSRSESRDRNNAIEGLRQDLLRRESTHGRRRPGAIAPVVSNPQIPPPSLTVQQASPRNPMFDEEAQVGLMAQASAAYAGGIYGSSLAAGSTNSNNPYTNNVASSSASSRGGRPRGLSAAQSSNSLSGASQTQSYPRP